MYVCKGLFCLFEDNKLHADMAHGADGYIIVVAFAYMANSIKPI